MSGCDIAFEAMYMFGPALHIQRVTLLRAASPKRRCYGDVAGSSHRAMMRALASGWRSEPVAYALGAIGAGDRGMLCGRKT